MGFYKPLFTVSVEHMYFSDGLWKGLEFLPSLASAKVIKGADLLVRQTGNGVGVFYDEDKSGVLRLYAEDANGVLPFGFRVYAHDRTFANYTAPSIRRDDAILCFDSAGAVGGADAEKVQLSKDDFVSEKDYEGMGGLIADGILSERDRRVPPDFAVRISVRPGSNGGFDSIDYGIRFNARQSFLKYHLIGNMNRSNPFIVDMDNQVEFEFCGEVVLPGNKPAKVFRSKALIPLLEKSNYRFQLREQGQGAGKVLIKRLPVASENRLGVEVINGKTEIVSESFINY